MGTLGILLGLLVGCFFFVQKPRKPGGDLIAIERTPDYIAWAFSAMLIFKGYQYEDFFISLAGSCLAAVHICRFAVESKSDGKGFLK